MINQEELAICRRRGHPLTGLGVGAPGWCQCPKCGMWLREIRTLEEREDEPPESEMSAGERTDRKLASLNK